MVVKECYVCEKPFKEGDNITKVSTLLRHDEYEPGSENWAKSQVAKMIGMEDPFSKSENVVAENES